MNDEEEFETVFNVLDCGNVGYLSRNEVQEFYEKLFEVKVERQLVSFALHSCEGTPDKCSRKNFQIALQKIEECRVKEEDLYWDFDAFSTNEKAVLDLKNALFLAKNIDGNSFSVSKWQAWNQSRQSSLSPVSWNEFCQYLYFIPSDVKSLPPSTFSSEYEKFDNLEKTTINAKYQDAVNTLEEDDDYIKNIKLAQKDHKDSVEYQSGRLLNRWNQAGLESVIYDDGEDWGSPEPKKVKKKQPTESISLPQVISSISEKYDLLRSQLLLEMAVSSADGKNMDEIYTKLLSEEKELRSSKNYEKIIDLNGSSLTFNLSLSAAMGDTTDAYEMQWKEAEQRYQKYKTEGKSTDEINKIFEEETLKLMESSYPAVTLLKDLLKREEEEQNYLLEKLKNVQNPEFQRVLMYSSLKHQCRRIQSDKKSFILAATSAALAERKQSLDFERYNPDQTRQIRLASSRFENLDKIEVNEFGEMDTDTPIVQQMLQLIKVSMSQYSIESSKAINWLTATDEAASAELTNASISELNARRRKLKSQLEQLLNNKESTEDFKQKYLSMLQKSVFLYQEDLKRNKVFSNIQEASPILLSQIQTAQDVEFYNTIHNLNSKDDIQAFYNKARNAIKDEIYENIFKVVFAVIKSSPEEDALAALILEKYDIMRQQIFMNYVNKQQKSGDERESVLGKLRTGEKKARTEENHSKLARLCKTFEISYSLQEVMGPEMSIFEAECKAGFERLQDSARSKLIVNEQINELSDDVSSVDGNLLSQLHKWYKDEVNVTLERIRAEEVDVQPFIILQETVWQKWQIMTSELYQDFTLAALSVGLKNRTKLGDGKIKLRQDNNRYIRTAQELLALSTPLKSLSQSQTKSTVTETSLKKVLGCHLNEWRKLIDLLQDSSAEELREAATVMTEDERTVRLAEIDKKRSKIDTKSSDWQEDLTSLLEEAAAIKFVTRQQNMITILGAERASTITNEDITTSIMADLQEEHDRAGLGWFKKAIEDPENVSKIKNLVVKDSQMATNIFNVLCKYDGSTDDDELIQALEDKYDALRDKLYADWLLKQLGKKRWQEMNERERQRMIMKMKLEERRLRKEGNFDELTKLLRGHLDDEERLRKLFGMSKEEYERYLKERLANRKRVGDGGADEVEEDDAEAEALLKTLTTNFEDERDALLRMLQGQDDRFLSERDRQLEIARLRREMRKAQHDDFYGAASLVLGFSERNSRNSEIMEKHRKQQKELAKLRLEALRNKRKSGDLSIISEEDEEIITEGGKPALIDAVIKKLEILYEAERAWMIDLLSKQTDLKSTVSGIKEVNPIEVRNKFSSTEITDFLNVLHIKLPGNEVDVKEHSTLLVEASLLREAIIAHLAAEGKNKEELDVAMLTVLDDIHNQASKTHREDFPDMSDADLIELQKRIIENIKQGKSSNLMAVLFSTSNSLTDAVQAKYDAILDAIITSSLTEKYGKDKWDTMPKEERDKLVNELKDKLRQLVADGNMEEAEKLLGGNYSELLTVLFGSKDEDEERKRLLEERLARKRQRIADGMSEEEAQALFDKEALEDEELLKRRRKNILDNLKYDLDAQREALMSDRLKGDKRLEEERRRQMEMAKLRLQERMMRREQDIDAITALLALSQSQVDQYENERERQLALARARLEAYKNRKDKNIVMDNSPLELPDTEDTGVLIAIIMKELESKHANEREVLIKILTDESLSEQRNNIKNLQNEEMKAKFSELRSLREQWRNDDPMYLKETQHEQIKILNEASLLARETHFLLLKSQKDDVTEADVCAEILSILQKDQMKEASYLIEDLPTKNAVTLRAIAKAQWQARVEQWLDNVASCLLNHDEYMGENEEVVKALNEKYDMMKNKLITEALMKNIGDQEWAAMSERERQRKIFEFKMEERKLRNQGKMDEAAALIQNLLKNDEDLAKLFGKAKLSQEEEIKLRLERRKQLKEEREKAGLATDDKDLDKVLDAEDAEENKKRKNILLSLEMDMEKEKAALLSELQRHDDYVTLERKRQLEIAKLRHQQRQMDKSDHLHSIAMIFSTGKKHEAALQSNLEATRNRQLALAKERLAARKAKAAMKEIFDVDKIEKYLENMEKDDSTATDKNLVDRLMKEVELKHNHEEEVFMLFSLSADIDKDELKQIESMTAEEIQKEWEKLTAERKEWREQRLITALYPFEEDANDPGKKDRRRKLLAASIVDQNKLLKKLFMLEIEKIRRDSDGKDFMTVKNEKSVEWLATIQETQTAAVDVVGKLVADKTDDVLDMIRKNHHLARMEHWHDNYSKVIANILPPGQAAEAEQQRPESSTSLEQETENVEQEMKKEMDELDNKIEEAKKEIERKKLNQEDIDVDSALAALQAQYDAEKNALVQSKNRQKQAIQEKLRARRQEKDSAEYEAYAAASMVFLAEKRIQTKLENEEKGRMKNKTLMQERLEARRQQRKEQEEAALNESHESKSTSSTENKALPPRPMLKREKTVANFSITDDERAKLMEDLHKKSEFYQEKQRKEREKQLKRIQDKIETKKQKKVDQVQELLSRHDREMTMVREKTQSQIERQKKQLKDRITNIRTGKTITMKEKSDKNKQDFDKLIGAEEAKGLTEDEKMARVAETLQKNLSEQHGNEAAKLPENNEETSTSEDVAPTSVLSRGTSKKLSREEQQKVLKKRQMEKKLKRQEEEERQAAEEVND